MSMDGHHSSLTTHWTVDAKYVSTRQVRICRRLFYRSNLHSIHDLRKQFLSPFFAIAFFFICLCVYCGHLFNIICISISPIHYPLSSLPIYHYLHCRLRIPLHSLIKLLINLYQVKWWLCWTSSSSSTPAGGLSLLSHVIPCPAELLETAPIRKNSSSASSSAVLFALHQQQQQQPS